MASVSASVISVCANGFLSLLALQEVRVDVPGPGQSWDRGHSPDPRHGVFSISIHVQAVI